MAVEPDALLERIDEVVEAEHIKFHPLVEEICAGRADTEALRGFARQFFFVGPKPNPRPHCAVYAYAPEGDPDIENLWFGDVLMEEATGSHSGTSHHLRIYFDWCATLGLSDEDMAKVDPIPETAAFEQWRYFNAYKGDWIAAIAGIAFIESASAKRNDLLIESFVNNYGYERGSDGLKYWEIHASEIEEGHGDIGPAIVRRYALDDYTQNRVWTAVRRSIDLQWLAFDGMHRAFIQKDPRYTRWQE